MENDVKQLPSSSTSFPTMWYQNYSISYPSRCYILSTASLPIQLKLSQCCKDFAQRIRKRHDYQVDSLYVNYDTNTYRVNEGEITIYPSTDFLLKQNHPFVVKKTMLLFNESAEYISKLLSKLDYTNVEEVYLSCCEVKLEDFQTFFVPSLKLIAHWSSNIVDGKTNISTWDIDDYVQSHYPNVHIHFPD